MKNESRYFSEREFELCSPSCTIDDMDADFLALMDKVREKAGIPLVINSAYRSTAWEKGKGRSGSSSHCKGIAVDIRCHSLQNRMKIVRAALEVGVRRMGIAPTYIHIDADGDKTQDVVWIYDKENKQY